MQILSELLLNEARREAQVYTREGRVRYQHEGKEPPWSVAARMVPEVSLTLLELILAVKLVLLVAIATCEGIARGLKSRC